ncbi:sarcosine oxidase subunit delta [Thiohalorhabdus methylotrophus]|uniref:Sarcosine oxidase subunit delta n=1 Tax=Thiohalorhabdus methylotrophus TaxID=3242694 RepID=A0ABV4TV58_9GAMM
MKLVPCPLNGWRPASEFAYGGPVEEMPDPQQCTDEEWMHYVYGHDGAPGVQKEWWYHNASGTWFVAERDTAADKFIRSYLP